MKGGVRKRGAVWYYYYEVTIDGKRKKIERSAGSGAKKSEAEELLRTALNQLDGGFVKPTKVSFENYINDWLADTVKTNLKITTYHRYESVVRNKLLPYLKGVLLKDVKPIHVDKILNEARKQGHNESGVQNIYGVFSSAMNHAKELQLIHSNPCDAIKRPKRAKFKANILTVEEFQTILKHLDTKKYRDYIFTLALNIELETGLRRGELAALGHDSIIDNVISVSDNLVYANGKTYMQTTKTDESTRDVVISEALKNLIKDHQKLQLANRQEYAEHYANNIYNGKTFNPVLTWEDGKIIHPLYYTNRWTQILDELGIDRRIRFHDLRHTNASLLLKEGVSLKTIQERLGHADIMTTANLYTKIDYDMQKEASDKLVTLFRGGKAVAKSKKSL